MLALAVLHALWCVGAVPVSACLCLLQLHAYLATAPVRDSKVDDGQMLPHTTAERQTGAASSWQPSAAWPRVPTRGSLGIGVRL